MSKTDFQIRFKVSTAVKYRIKVLYSYRTGWNGSVCTTCLLFIYSDINTLPNDLNLQTASSAGFAKCIPSDQFSKDVGRKLVLARAMKDAQLSRESRTQIWEQYHDGKYNK